MSGTLQSEINEIETTKEISSRPTDQVYVKSSRSTMILARVALKYTALSM